MKDNWLRFAKLSSENLIPAAALSKENCNMSISFETTNANNLLYAFKKAITDGHVQTWTCDSDGDFTHNVDQWRYKAYMRPSVQSGRLVMTILGSSKQITTWAIYSVYQGRFIEAMTSHCHSLFSTAIATSAPTSADALTSQVA
jgi:hypothetical protein